jgi:hypothetical protein
VLLAVALPAFVAGASLDAPVAALAWVRLEAAALREAAAATAALYKNAASPQNPHL